MSDWNPFLQQTFVVKPNESPACLVVDFEVFRNIHALRFKCEFNIEELNQDQIDSAFQNYVQGFELNDLTIKNLKETFSEQIKKSTIFEILFWDSNNVFRGRWDAHFDGWKIIEDHHASDGFISGEIPPGYWRLELRTHQLLNLLNVEIKIDESTTASKQIPELHIYQPDDEIPDEEAPSFWMIGELYETTTRSNGAHSVNKTLSIYQEQDCGFVVLADENQPPLKKYTVDPGLSVIRGQSLSTPEGKALLIGVQEPIDWRDDDGAKPLYNLIRETHMAGGLFCVSEPFAIQATHSTWLDDKECQSLIDLIHIWPETWESRFLEIQKAMHSWDALLNQGVRIYGIAGKGPTTVTDNVRIPKTVVYTQGKDETALLSAIKQGRFYSTVEPALSFWTESANGGGIMGDELRLPIGMPFILYISISQLDKGGYFIIRNSEGVYCQTPYSTRKDTTFKLVLSAHNEWQWFRLEVYQFGRPFDRLLAYCNPIFIRGIVST